jgi:hypothetical protein
MPKLTSKKVKEVVSNDEVVVAKKSTKKSKKQVVPSSDSEDSEEVVAAKPEKKSSKKSIKEVVPVSDDEEEVAAVKAVVKKSKKVVLAVDDAPVQKRARDEPAAPAVKSKKPKTAEVEKNPFAVLDSDPMGMTEDMKREVRVKTQALAMRLVKGNVTQVSQDTDLNNVKLDHYERIAADLKEKQRLELKRAVVSLKWKELHRHLQVFSVRPPPNVTAAMVKTAKEAAEKASHRRKTVVYENKYKKRMQVKFRSGEWDFNRPSKEEKKANVKKAPRVEKRQVDKQAIADNTAAAAVPSSAVAQRIALAKEAAMARMKLTSMADDE